MFDVRCCGKIYEDIYFSLCRAFNEKEQNTKALSIKLYTLFFYYLKRLCPGFFYVLNIMHTHLGKLWWLICAMSYYRVFGAKKRKGEKAPRENPPNDDFFVFSHGDLSPRHTKVRDIPCVAFSATVCRIFDWRGERLPCENATKSPFGGFSRGDLSLFSPRKHVYTTWHKSAAHFPRIFRTSLVYLVKRI